VTREQIRAGISDTTAVIATLLGEAAGEPVEGQIAVACVIRNRVRHPRWWGSGWRGVCLQKWQFSCWWETTPNSERVYALARALMDKQAATGPQSVVSQLDWIAAGVMDDLLMDVTQNADHYLTRALLLSGKAPAWAKANRSHVRVASHQFYRLEI
jgi:hypothetical protein